MEEKMELKWVALWAAEKEKRTGSHLVGQLEDWLAELKESSKADTKEKPLADLKADMKVVDLEYTMD